MGHQLAKIKVNMSATQPIVDVIKAQPTKNEEGQVEGHDIRLDLLLEIGKKASSASEVSKIVDEIVTMTRQTLRASASSLLLIDEEKQELYFEFADGTAGGRLRQARLSIQSGIAGWVARHGCPLIVNDVTKDRRFFAEVDKSTGFVTKAIMCVPLVVRGKVIGVIEVLNKLDGSDFNNKDLEILVAVATTAAIAIENSKLHQLVIDGYKGTMKALAAAIDAKDPYTRGHSQRVVDYALLCGLSLSLPQKELEVLEYASILHDIGKIAIADSILSKPGYLTAEEYCAFLEHPVIGANMIDSIPFLKAVRGIVLHHHERYDGSGYPDGLKGNDIPMGALILAVADTFDSITTDRPYRAALSADHAIHELRRCSGSQFSPIAVDAFISGFEKRSQYLLQRDPEIAVA
jgi:HD-GYP domain-containing protein (c-di-GMP phosphodiesterase class II)